jgi:hypothetical protein
LLTSETTRKKFEAILSYKLNNITINVNQPGFSVAGYAILE